MSGPFGSSQWMYQSAAGFYPYEIEQSLRFNDDDSAYLSRTPSSSGSQRTFTFSAWVKRSELGTGFSARNSIFGSDDTNSPNRGIIFKFQDDALDFISSGGGVARVTSNAVYRDASAWYHCLLAIDTTQATASNRIKMYVNGEQVTSLLNTVYPSQNEDFNINTASYQMRLGVEEDTNVLTNFFDGYMAEVNFIDGTALDPTSFGETKSGIWVPKAYSGSYGTNGFYLSFADSAAIGDDLSGNGNDWTANNLVSTDVLLDSPTNNWCVLNPLDKGSATTLAEGNLKVSAMGSDQRVHGSFGMSSGKWYFEYVKVSGIYGAVGISLETALPSSGFVGADASSWGYNQNGNFYNNNSIINSSPDTYTSGDVIGVAFDADANSVTFYKNNVSQGSITGLSDAVYVPAYGDLDTVGSANFGQDSSFAGNKTAQGNTDANGQGDFYYAPPAGYLALNTANLPDPAIDPAQDDVPADYFNTVLWTGDGTSPRSITGFGFNPDFVWSKTRSEAHDHRLTDAVRGAADGYLSSNTTATPSTSFGRVLSFITDGIEINDLDGINGSGDTTVAWAWLAGNGTSSNTDGSITSTVSVNQTSGFSVVTGTAPASSVAFTTGHGLGVTPAMIITKVRSGTAYNWWTWHKALSNPAQSYLGLNLTNAAATDATLWANTAPASTVWSMTSGNYPTNSQDFVAYCFAEVEGYSKFGSYTGNGSTDGPFVYCGFRPAWVMVKQTSASGENWEMWDAERGSYNINTPLLYANLSNAETAGTAARFDVLSNGFKARSTNAGVNASGATYIFMAFAEAPFKYSNAR